MGGSLRGEPGREHPGAGPHRGAGLPRRSRASTSASAPSTPSRRRSAPTSPTATRPGPTTGWGSCSTPSTTSGATTCSWSTRSASRWTTSRPGPGDTAWDGIWDVGRGHSPLGVGRRDRVPFSTLRFQRTEPAGVGLRRGPRLLRRHLSADGRLPARPEQQLLPLPGDQDRGLRRGVSPGRNLEIVPTMIATRTDVREELPEGPRRGRLESELGHHGALGLHSQPDAERHRPAGLLAGRGRRPAARRQPSRSRSSSPRSGRSSWRVQTSSTPAWTPSTRGCSATRPGGSRSPARRAPTPSGPTSSRTRSPTSSFRAASARTAPHSRRQPVQRAPLQARHRRPLHPRRCSAPPARATTTSTGSPASTATSGFPSRTGFRSRSWGRRPAIPATSPTGFEQPVESFDDLAAELIYEHETRSLSWWGVYSNVGTDFRADLGFMPRSTTGSAKSAPTTPGTATATSWYSRIDLELELNHSEDQAGNLLDEEAEVQLTIQGPLSPSSSCSPATVARGTAARSSR